MARRVLVVVQVAFGLGPVGPRIEGVDEHPGNRGRPGYLDSRLFQVIRDGRYRPVARVDLRDGRVRGHGVLVEGLSEHFKAGGQQLAYSRREVVVHEGQVLYELGGEDLRGPLDRCVLYSRARDNRHPYSSANFVTQQGADPDTSGRPVPVPLPCREGVKICS